MTRWRWVSVVVLALGITSGSIYWMVTSAPSQVQGAEFAEKIDGSKLSYAKDIQPLLQEKCANCHNSKKKKAGLDIETSYETAVKGIKPEKPDDSKLYKSLIGKGAKQMPPKSKLTDQDIEKIRAWIEAGAKNN